MTAEEKDFLWKQKRVGLITSSVLPLIATKGKGTPFGKTALSKLYEVRYERRTGNEIESRDNYNFAWGREYEPYAIEWLKKQFLFNEVKSCSGDFDEIVFNTPFDGFGDSPDFYIYDLNGNIEYVGEIKCPISQSKIEELQFMDKITPKSEYFEQFLGHFLGCPEVNKLMYVIYDGYAHQGKTIVMHREDFEKELEELRQRIILANNMINCSLQENISLEELNETKV